MILFVFEGARREPMLFESIKYLFFEKETDTIVYSFGNNIYNLYKQIMELGTGDIVSLLREIQGQRIFLVGKLSFKRIA